jgi:hypothetical protein
VLGRWSPVTLRLQRKSSPFWAALSLGKVTPGGTRATAMVAAGDADIAILPVSEILQAKDVDFAGSSALLFEHDLWRRHEYWEPRIALIGPGTEPHIA